MEQIIGIILTLVLSGIIAAVKERNKRKTPRRVYEPDDFILPEAHIPPVPEISEAFTPIPEEGERVTADAPAEPEPASDSGQLAAHRERWRKAIIDAEILNRKF